MNELDGDVRYADGGPIVASAFNAFLPGERVNVAEFAAGHRWLANEGGGYVGRWEHAQAPYLVAPMETLTAGLHATEALVGPGQCGKTSVGENWLLSIVPNDPADLLWYMQTDAGVEAYVKGRINVMIEQHPEELRNRLGPRPVDDSLHFKRFRGMNVEFLSATFSNLINKRAPRIIADEIDAYPPGLGDVKVMLDVRRQTFGDDSMLLAMSHCDKARGLDAEGWSDGIMAIYADSDRRVWYWPCPHCNGVSSPNPTAARVMTLVYPEKAPLDEIEQAARLLCPLCGTLIEDRWRRAMNQAAFAASYRGWVGLGQEIAPDGALSGALVRRRTAGFWIVGLMSLFIAGGIGALARARVKAEREFESSGDDATLRQVVVKQWGLPYTPPRQAGTVDANTLAANADPRLKLGMVANGVRFLTAFADVQGDRFEVLVRGWGERGQSWIVDFFKLERLSPAIDAAAWDVLLERVVRRRYELADGSGRTMAIRSVGFDSAGAPGVTTQAGDAWLRFKAANAVRLYGTSSGRHLWSVIPTKGAAGADAPRLQVSYPDTQRKGKLAAHGAVPLLLFNANLFKDDLRAQLGTETGAAWSVNFPVGLRSEPPPHVFFEQLVAERRDRRGRWEKEHAGVRNETMDLMVGTHALARLHGVGRIDWAQPPAWAAPWEHNTMIAAREPVAATAAAAAPAHEPATQLSPAERGRRLAQRFGL